MLKYKLKHNNLNNERSIIKYLNSFGIYNYNSFLNVPLQEDELNPFLLDNMEKTIDELHKGFTQGKKFFLQIDSDVDGYTSASIFYSFFTRLYPDANIMYRMHDGKEHGVIVDTVPDDVDYIILPDSGSMQLREHQQLKDKGKKVIILDHHTVDINLEDFNDNVFIVNNQISKNFYNKSLSGAGVTFKVIQAYNTKYPNMYVKYNYYYDLAALGIISDMMNITTLDNNYIIYQGLHNINNEMFKALLDKQQYYITDLIPTKMQIAFYVTPIINGVIREGSQEEKEMLFRGFIEKPTNEYIDTTYNGEQRHETFYKYVARTSYNVKSRQDTKKEKSMRFLKEKIEKEGLDKNKILVVVTSKDDPVQTPQNITGLVAMELLNEYKKPTLVLRPKVEDDILHYAGSGRGKKYDGFNSFLSFIKGSNFTEYGEGHDMAFGTSIIAENLDNFIKESNERLKNINLSEDYVEVDAIYDKVVDKNLLYDFAKHNYIYGTGLPEPLIAVKSLYNSSNIRLMKNNSCRVSICGIDCIGLKNKELYEQLENNPNGEIVIIGKPDINTFMGNENVQLKIVAFDIKPLEIKNLF